MRPSYDKSTSEACFVYKTSMQIQMENTTASTNTETNKDISKALKGLAPYRKARKNTRWNCPIWVQLGGYDCLLM